MLKLWLTIKVFIKGMIMGAVNVFPVSSGTASLILGVFERFVNAIKALNHKNFKYLPSQSKGLRNFCHFSLLLGLPRMKISEIQ